jgi:hypothetical protein
MGFIQSYLNYYYLKFKFVSIITSIIKTTNYTIKAISAIININNISGMVSLLLFNDIFGSPHQNPLLIDGQNKSKVRINTTPKIRNFF